MNEIKLYDRVIRKDLPPFIMAEAGINHNGEIDKAFEMIRIAKDSGVDAIKFQTFKAKEFILDETLTYTYFSQGKKLLNPNLNFLRDVNLVVMNGLKLKKNVMKKK